MSNAVKRRAVNRLVWALALGAIAAGLYSNGDLPASRPQIHALSGPNVRSISQANSQGCSIKGNINTAGERIYHVPGQKYYAATAVNPGRGERWFCSQWEAWWAGLAEG